MLLMAVIVVFSLSACGNVADDLQSNQWNLVSEKGSSAVADFGEKTGVFDIGMMKVGFDYEISDNKIDIIHEKGTYKYKIEKDGKEYKFVSEDEATKNSMGDLTLSPSK